MPSRIALVAGEASGDVLGAGLIRAVLAERADVEFVGIGGPQMASAGMDCWHDVSELSVMGFSEVARHLPRLLKLRRALVRRLLASKIDVFVGIDAPDFNLGIARKMKLAGIPTLHYVSPSIWAWRPGRAEKIGASVDEVLTLFPFEPEIYARYGVRARFVGHPTADRLPLEPDRQAARASLGIPADGQVLAVLPGSRGSEVAKLGPLFFAAVAELVKRHSDLRMITPVAAAHLREPLRAMLEDAGVADRVTLVDGKGAEALRAADFALVASGTAALEALLAKTPMVVGYQIAPLTYFIVTVFRMMKVTRFSLPNVLAGRELVPELMQDRLTVGRIVDTLSRLLSDPEEAQAIRDAFRSIHQQLAFDADKRVAEAVLERLC